jgi:hypothetical protein
MPFKEAVEATPNLNGKWKKGLRALRAEDKRHVRIQDASEARLRGSVDIDSALRDQYPNANRWDFAIGYQHTDRRDEFIYWVEFHTGSDNQIGVVLRKLEWLKTWLRAEGWELARFEKLFVWVPSGATSFTQGSPQVKSLVTRGIFYSGSVFKIGINRS